MTDFNTLNDTDLAAKRKWYAARGDRFANQIATIDAILDERNPLNHDHGTDASEHDGMYDDVPADFPDDSGAQDHKVEPTVPARSVVKQSYKAVYKARGDARTCGDWLASTLGTHCNDPERKLIVPAFEAILTDNGIAHEHWNRTTAGWQGRLRMTGRMALARRVVETGVLVVNGAVITAPDEWVLSHGG